MYRRTFDFFDLLETLFPIVIALVILAMPVTGYLKVASLQRILNTECKGNYSIIDVALNGNELLKTCQINNQSITIK